MYHAVAAFAASLLSLCFVSRIRQSQGLMLCARDDEMGYKVNCLIVLLSLLEYLILYIYQTPNWAVHCTLLFSCAELPVSRVLSMNSSQTTQLAGST